MTDTITTETTVPQGNTAFIAWGPDHPEWDDWWQKAGEIADEHEMCPEYERLVGLLGGKGRAPKHADYEQVRVRVSLDVYITVGYEEDVEGHQVRQAIYDLGTDDMRSQIVEWTEEHREEVDE
jgi:hypothetical protein